MIDLVNRLRWTLEVIEALIVVQYANETGKEMRCHEIARITCNVLHQLGYHYMEVVDGVFLTGKSEAMTHSWIEGSFDIYSARILIETKPYDDKICPDAENKERGEFMLISEWDNRAKSYIQIESKEFSKRLEKENTKIDNDLVERYSHVFTKKFLSKEGQEKLTEHLKQKALQLKTKTATTDG
jgi:hypothetical protein